MLSKTFSNMEIFKNRRQRLAELAPNSVFVFFSGEESHLSTFRAESSFVYYTGFEEPGSVAVICTCKNHNEFSLFVREKNPAIEIWDGERFGIEKAKSEFNADHSFGMSELDHKLGDLLHDCERVYFNLGADSFNDSVILNARDQAQQKRRRSGSNKIPIFDPNEVVAQMRVVKDDNEIAWMREAAELSSLAHINVMKNVKPGMNERQVQAYLFFSFYEKMASQEGYSSIIASGGNACTLHYRANNREMQDGDFLLIDAGAEKNYYTADITRTYPINGKFTAPQRDIYAAVLDTQEKLIALAKPGYSLPELHDESIRLLTQNMLDLKLLKGGVSENIESGAYKKYYPHGVGHYLGMDVHDVGFSKQQDRPVPFVPGMVHTIEPGIYVPEDDDSAPEELRGLGVRIEDDILITDKGNEVLTETAPKTVQALEETLS